MLFLRGLAGPISNHVSAHVMIILTVTALVPYPGQGKSLQSAA